MSSQQLGSRTPRSRGSGGCPSGFTLRELCVLVVLAAVMLAVVTVATSQVTVNSRMSLCKYHVSDLLQNMAMYAASNNNEYPGPNTSGRAIHPGIVRIDGNRTSTTPTQDLDWMSPMLASEQLPVNRAERLQRLLSRFRCHFTTRNNDRLSGATVDLEDFVSALQNGGLRQVSYLSPSAFHIFGSLTAARQNGYVLPSGQVYAGRYDASFVPVRVPDSFRPRLDLVGTQASNKAFVLDGTRYFSNNSLDVDVREVPAANTGNFLDSGPTHHESRAYGRGVSSGAPTNWQLSFRHPNDEINVGYFDGSLRRMTATQAWTDATPWYPGGSVFNGALGTAESRSYHTPGQVLP